MKCQQKLMMCRVFMFLSVYHRFKIFLEVVKMEVQSTRILYQYLKKVFLTCWEQ